MVTYIEFRAHVKKHGDKVTPTGKGKHDGVQDFINFVKERDLSLMVTDIGHVYAVGDSLIAHLGETKKEDVDRVETALKDRLHWPVLMVGYDPRVDVRTIRRFIRHSVSSIFHGVRLKRGRRKREW